MRGPRGPAGVELCVINLIIFIMKIGLNTKRYLAMVLDLHIIAAGVVLILFPFGFNENSVVPFYLLAVILVPCFIPNKIGATFGQYLFNLKMIDSRTGTNPPIKNLIIREILFLTGFTGIGFLIAVFTGFYWDRISKTSVIETKGNIKNMINFVKNNKLLIWGGLLGIIFFSLFYWFQIRPSKAYGECSRIAEDEAKAKFPVAWQTTSNYRDFYNLIYSQCLRNKGIDQ